MEHLKTAQVIYNEILHDKDILNLYEKIHQFEDATQGYAHHDFNHVMNVVDICEKLLTELNYDEEFIYETKIAALLHDTGCVEGKENHTIRSYEFAKKYFKEKNIQLKNSNLVLEAIKNHSSGFDTENCMQLCLVLADKLDIKKNRISEFGKTVIGNRQYQYINDISFKIKNKNFDIYFDCDKHIDLEELNDYYFTEKMFHAVLSFSKKMNLEPNLFINNEKWAKFYEFIIS